MKRVYVTFEDGEHRQLVKVKGQRSLARLHHDTHEAGMMGLVTIKCSDKGAKHFQADLKVRGDVAAAVDDFLDTQRECHVCDATLKVIRNEK
jgi:hypothetical protein